MMLTILLLLTVCALFVGLWSQRTGRDQSFTIAMAVFAVALLAAILNVLITLHASERADDQAVLIGTAEPYRGVLYYGRHYRLNSKASNVPCLGKRFDIEATTDKSIADEGDILKREGGVFLQAEDTFLVLATSDKPETVVQIKPETSKVACWVTRADLMAMIVTATPEPAK